MKIHDPMNVQSKEDMIRQIDGLIEFLEIKKDFTDDYGQKYSYSEIISYLEGHKRCLEFGLTTGFHTTRENKDA